MPFWSSQRSFRGILTEFDRTCFLRFGGGRGILKHKRTSVLFKSTIGTPRSRVSCPASRRCIPQEFSGSVLPVSPLHWSLASSRPSLTHPSNPLLLASLSFPPSHPSSLRRGIFIPSLFFLLGTSLRPHAGRDVTRPARGRIQTSAPFFVFE